MIRPKLLLICIPVLFVFSSAAYGQEKKTYAHNGLSFEYLSNWTLTENAGNESDEVALLNNDADSQITVILVRKRIDSKDPLVAARTQVVDPWLEALIDRYSSIAKIDITRTDITTEVAGIPTDGVKLTFTLDGQQGSIDVCWVLMDKRLALLYMVGPNSKADVTEDMWGLIRSTLRIGDDGK